MTVSIENYQNLAMAVLTRSIADYKIQSQKKNALIFFESDCFALFCDLVGVSPAWVLDQMGIANIRLKENPQPAKLTKKQMEAYIAIRKEGSVTFAAEALGLSRHALQSRVNLINAKIGWRDSESFKHIILHKGEVTA